MSVTIVVPGKFQTAYHLARHLEQKGRLERLITPMPYKRVATFGLSRRRMVCLSPFAYWTHGVARYGPSRLWPQTEFSVNAVFGRAASRLIGEPESFLGWCGCALEGIRRAHALGIPAVLQSGSAHIGWQTDILREEFQRFCYDGPLTHPRMVTRCLDEIAEADAIVVPSRFALRTFVERGVPESKLRLVPWGVTSLTSPPDERTNDVPRILFVGNFTLQKGIPYLLDAFRSIGTPATLRLVSRVDRRLAEVVGGLPEGADALERVPESVLAAEYREADVFVMPSVQDGAPYAVTEAMHAGLPIVMSDHTGADQVEDGVNGFVVPARDVTALAARLEQLVADRALRQRMGHAAHAAVASHTDRDFASRFEETVLATVRDWGLG